MVAVTFPIYCDQTLTVSIDPRMLSFKKKKFRTCVWVKCLFFYLQIVFDDFNFYKYDQPTLQVLCCFPQDLLSITAEMTQLEMCTQRSHYRKLR